MEASIFVARAFMEGRLGPTVRLREPRIYVAYPYVGLSVDGEGRVRVSRVEGKVMMAVGEEEGEGEGFWWCVVWMGPEEAERLIEALRAVVEHARRGREGQRVEVV